MPAITSLITLNSSLKSVLSYLYFFTLGATFTAFLKLILDNPFQIRMVAKFYKGFIHSFFSLRHNIGFNDKANTGKNEEFELFEIGRKLYYKLANIEPYSSYDRFTNTLKSEKLRNIRELVPNIDENLAKLCEKILHSKEQDRAVVFSEVLPFISLD